MIREAFLRNCAVLHDCGVTKATVRGKNHIHFINDEAGTTLPAKQLPPIVGATNMETINYENQISPYGCCRWCSNDDRRDTGDGRRA
jgi:hypothetical protein